MPPLTVFCNTILSSIRKKDLLQIIYKLPVDAKQSLYFLYSEFILRANKNAFYRAVLNKTNLSAIDGRGLEWTNWTLTNQEYTKHPTYLVIPLLILSLIWNAIAGFFVIVFRFPTINKTNNEVILGRNFVYDLFNVANQLKWRLFIVGASDDTVDNIHKKYPHLFINNWYKDKESLLMQDIGLRSGVLTDLDERHTFLRSETLFTEFPALIDARNSVARNHHDIILVCLGGASGKQEFFIDHLKKDPQVHFRLCVGLGAALDHLGSGVGQKRVPKFLEDHGLESLYRIFTNPMRGFRTWHSIYTLWWFTTLQSFIELGREVKFINLFK
jgi:UDP-N-acetyl-D-mannosaminuronic acid transferase (WecB/TagA/CpsF family)